MSNRNRAGVAGLWFIILPAPVIAHRADAGPFQQIENLLDHRHPLFAFTAAHVGLHSPEWIENALPCRRYVKADPVTGELQFIKSLGKFQSQLTRAIQRPGTELPAHDITESVRGPGSVDKTKQILPVGLQHRPFAERKVRSGMKTNRQQHCQNEAMDFHIIPQQFLFQRSYQKRVRFSSLPSNGGEPYG